VIPGEDHDPKIGNGEEIAGALKNDLAQLIIFEGVAGQQIDVGPQHPGSNQHRAQARRPVTVMQARRMVLVDMQVRTVDEDDFFVHRQSYNVRLGRQQRRHSATLVRSSPAALWIVKRQGAMTKFTQSR
jgi:hypothetical protein